MTIETRIYSEMLYSLAGDIDSDEGCFMESAETLREAAQRLDEQTVTIRSLIKQRDELLADAQRYRWLRIHGLQRAWVSLGTDCDGENYAQFKCEFKVPEHPNLPYEDDEGLEWADKDFDVAIDAAIASAKGGAA